MIEIDKLDEVFFLLHCEQDILFELKAHFSCFAENYKFNPKFKAGFWDGKISFFNVMTRTLPIGLLPQLLKYCKDMGHKYKFNFDVAELSNFVKDGSIKKFSDFVLKDTEFEVREHQEKAVELSIKNKRGIIRSATAAGKSMMIYLTIMYILIEDPEAQILLLVPSTSLVEQMYSDFKKYGLKDIDKVFCKSYSGKDVDWGKNIICSTWQSVYKKQKPFFDKFDCLMVDEVHHAKALSIKSIAEKCSNCEYRFGYTGTLPSVQSSLFNIYGYIGPKIFDLSSRELIDKGYLSKISIINVLMKYPDKVINENKKNDYFEEENFIASNRLRNPVIKKILDNIPDGQNSLILVRKIEHLTLIQQYLEENLDEKFLIENIYGKTKPEEREAIRMVMEKEKNMVLVSTFGTFAEGVSVNNLHNIFFGSSYKAEIKILQSIGRGLRKHESKDKMVLWDLVDDMRYTSKTGKVYPNHTYKHWKERLGHYKKEGFETKTMKLDL